MRYLPTASDLATEVRRIQQFTEQPTFPFLFLEEIHAVPDKLVAGMVVWADGTDWDPGSGAGIYWYDGSTWNLLG